ncbi:MAG: immunoglobulin domain-containing protein [Verrucomicrobia subdivision 3 bacterium]|nr:immunoglobulin domain-containing protein [Limisphaerales bacterium]
MAIQPDSKILIGGDFTGVNDVARSGIARLNSNGTLDRCFDPGTGFNNYPLAIEIQPDGKILVGGRFTAIDGVPRNRIARLNSDGSVDMTFNPGAGATDERVNSLRRQSSGKILISGRFTDFNGVPRSRLARLYGDGSLDPTFDPGVGANGFVVSSITLQSDGNAVIGGDFTTIDGTPRGRIARLNTNTPRSPVVLISPQSQSAIVGDNVVFGAVMGDGSNPLQYQWQLNGFNLPGQTNLTLGLYGVTLNQTGKYRLRVSNAVGSTMSSEADLLVNPFVPVRGFADVVLGYFDSGAGPMTGPYGGMIPQRNDCPIPVTLNAILGDDSSPVQTGLSLPRDSYVVVGFTDDSIFDGLGNDFTLHTAGGTNEQAEVSVSNDGRNFFVIGTADEGKNGTNAHLWFDLADLRSQGFIPPAVAIRVKGLDLGGTWPGFDLFSVQISAGSIGPTATTSSPDLVVENVAFAPASVQVGQSFGISFRIKNRGLGNAGPTQARLRLSADQTLTLSDQPLSPLDVDIGAIPGGQSFQFVGSATVPPGTPAGLYNVGVFADRDNRANQIDISNDAGLSTTRLVVTAPGALAPIITLQPQSQTVSNVQAVSFRVVATGDAPLSYQWRRNGYPILGATGASLNLVNVGMSQAGNYSVEVSNSGGTETSHTAILTVIGPANPAQTQPQPGTCECIEPFDRNLPTVVITHGWQLEVYTGRPPDWVTNMSLAITERLQIEGSRRANVLMFFWPGAYNDFQTANSYTETTGHTLARMLMTNFGSQYGQSIHLIGHSLGTIVNCFAASLLSGYNISNVTVLEAPISVLGEYASGWSEYFFRTHLPVGTVTWVDNYIGTDQSSFTPAVGARIAGAAPDGGLKKPLDHSGIHEFYHSTITNRNSQEGFHFSALLGSDGGFTNRPAPQIWNPPPPALLVIASEISQAASDGFRTIEGAAEQVIANVRGQFRNGIRLFKGLIGASSLDVLPGLASSSTNSAVAIDLTVPAGADQLTFDYFFTQLGAGDWVTIDFNGALLWSFRGDTFVGTNFQQAIVPIGQIAGRTGVLTVKLNSAGNASAEIIVSTFQFRSIPQPTLAAPNLSQNGVFNFTVRGQTNQSYTVHFSTNLVDWEELIGFTATNRDTRVVDPAAMNTGGRVYRARSP